MNYEGKLLIAHPNHPKDSMFHKSVIYIYQDREELGSIGLMLNKPSKFTLEDLQYTSENGYAKGISNVFIKNLNDMDITERPIHCSDQKRLQFYVKNDNEWTKDNNNEKIDNSIKKVSRKQMKSIQEWVEANPDYTESDDKMEEYFTLVRSITQPNDDKNLKNIKRKVGENVKIDK